MILADDEPKVCHLISQLADWERFDMQLVGEAHNGIAAMALIEQLRPDLVISDIKMPGYDGLMLLKAARTLMPEIEFVIISGYRQFEYAQTAIQYGVCDYLLKPISKEALNETLAKIYARHGQRSAVQGFENKIRLTLLRDLLDGKALSAATLPALNTAYQYHFEPEDMLSLFVLKADALDTAELDSEKKDDISNGLRENAWAMLKKHVLLQCHDLELLGDGYFVWGLLGAPEDTFRSVRLALLNALKELKMEFSLFSRLRLSMAITQPCASVEALPGAVEHARRMLGQRLTDRHTAMFEQLPQEISFPRQTMLANLTRDLEAAVDVMDTGRIRELLTGFTKELAGYNPAGYQVFAMVLEGYHTVRAAAQRSLMQSEPAVETRELPSEESFQSLAEQCGSTARLLQVFEQQALGMVADYQALISSNNTKPINMAKKYIQEHFAGHLSLEEISDYVGFNPSYFATLFKKETGQTIVEYLTDVRIQQARQMLRTTRLTAQEICDAVGYHDNKHFLKTFKKATGISPMEYRKLYPR